MKNPSPSQFTLTKVKHLASKGGLELNFVTKQTASDETYTVTHSRKSDRTPHPDLTGLLVLLKPFVSKTFRLDKIRFVALKTENMDIEDLYYSIVDKITVTGIALSGEDDKRKVVITSVYEVDNGQKVALNTNAIWLSGDIDESQPHQIHDIVNNIISECYEFLYYDKQAQQTIPIDDDDKQDPGDPPSEAVEQDVAIKQ